MFNLNLCDICKEKIYDSYSWLYLFAKILNYKKRSPKHLRSIVYSKDKITNKYQLGFICNECFNLVVEHPERYGAMIL